MRTYFNNLEEILSCMFLFHKMVTYVPLSKQRHQVFTKFLPLDKDSDMVDKGFNEKIINLIRACSNQ